MFLFVLQTLALFCTLNKFEHVGGFDVHRHIGRIIKGTDVNIKDYPYYAGLLGCGAAILSENWVVTAAHCVDHEWKYLNFISVGGESFGNSKFVFYDNVVVHERTNLSVPVHDIALLHLTKPLQFTETVQPVALPDFRDMTRSNTDLKYVFTGRGKDESGTLPSNLQKMDVVKLSTEECLSYIPREIEEQIKPILSVLEKAIICARRADGGPGLCSGDSGSPLVQGNTLVGLASFIGSSSCEDAHLGFYVNVESYVPWIKAVTGLN